MVIGGKVRGGINWETGIDTYTVLYTKQIIVAVFTLQNYGIPMLVAQMVKCLSTMRETWVPSLGSIPGSGRSAGEGNGNPLQYYCLENPMDRGAWQATVHGVTKSQTQLSDFTFTLTSL